jgi:hypothetical protein
MSFLAGGHLPDRGKYGDVLHRGIDFVLTCSQDDGQLTATARACTAMRSRRCSSPRSTAWSSAPT